MSPSGKWIVLDQHDIVIDVSTEISPTIQFCKGRCLWDIFPTARELLEPIYVMARQSGGYSETVHLDSMFLHLDCRLLPGGDLLVAVQRALLAQEAAKFWCRMCGGIYEDVLPPLEDLHWPSCCDTPSFLLEAI